MVIADGARLRRDDVAAADERGHRDQRRVSGHQRAETGDAGGDQDQVGHRADRQHRHHMASGHTGTQYEDVLGPDGDDQCGSGHQTGPGGEQCVHVGNGRSEQQMNPANVFHLSLG